METNKLEKSIQEVFDGQYKFIVPLYQRNFAWRRDEIEQLLQDIYEAYKTNSNSFYYIGSLIVLKRANGDFEVIDGQQRLTALSLITRTLNINDKPRLFYDSRPEVEDFFREFYDTGTCTIDYSQTFHLKNAIDYIKETSLDASGKEDVKISEDNSEIKEFKKYFANNVILVMVEIPQDTDVASYFEIMNNRGEQLQKHEILKSFMLSKLSITDPHKTKEFARIWNACSQMDIPIQKLFDAETRKRYFNKDLNNTNYDDFCFKKLDDEKCPTKESKTISKILFDTQDSTQTANNDNEDEQDADESIYKSIIDFPNFLMHVFKVMFPDSNGNTEIPLNEKFLLSTYKKLEDKIQPEQFIQTLFFCRTVFDRYIVKTISDKTDNEDGEKWTLRKPKYYPKSKNWEYVDTFGKDEDNNFTSYEQSRIIKALSMLQVTFRTRTYKNWLYEILDWFVNEKKKTFYVQHDEYIKKLDDIILSYYKPIGFQVLSKEISLTKDNSYSLGTKTPHFIFNFIDYLYWVKAKNENDNRIKDFDFKYWNSVEHHMAREWAERNDTQGRDNFIDNLGNLCLISKSSNSRLSDRDVKEKVDTFGKGNLGAKRQIMYKMTKDSGNTWDLGQIKEHYNELIELLNERETILAHNSETSYIEKSETENDPNSINHRATISLNQNLTDFTAELLKCISLDEKIWKVDTSIMESGVYLNISKKDNAEGTRIIFSHEDSGEHYFQIHLESGDTHEIYKHMKWRFGGRQNKWSWWKYLDGYMKRLAIQEEIKSRDWNSLLVELSEQLKSLIIYVETLEQIQHEIFQPSPKEKAKVWLYYEKCVAFDYEQTLKNDMLFMDVELHENGLYTIRFGNRNKNVQKLILRLNAIGFKISESDLQEMRYTAYTDITAETAVALIKEIDTKII